MPRSEPIVALFVVYDADGTHIGELLYMIRKLLGISHCSACEITHGPRTEKPEFTKLKALGWNVPLHNIHRDEMDAPLARSIGAVLPAVAARTASGRDILLLGPQQLDDCYGSVEMLEASVNAALAGSNLSSPPFPPQNLDAGNALRQQQLQHMQGIDSSDSSIDPVEPAAAVFQQQQTLRYQEEQLEQQKNQLRNGATPRRPRHSSPPTSSASVSPDDMDLSDREGQEFATNPPTRGDEQLEARARELLRSVPDATTLEDVADAMLLYTGVNSHHQSVQTAQDKVRVGSDQPGLDGDSSGLSTGESEECDAVVPDSFMRG
jgi:hypothetical protein